MIDDFYVGELRCGVCGRVYKITKLTEKFRYWVCFWTSDRKTPDRRPCRTMNIWRDND